VRCAGRRSRRIHWVYVMRHPDQPRPWRCGVNCAWRMEKGTAKDADTAYTPAEERAYRKEVERRLAGGFTIRRGEGAGGAGTAEDWKLCAARVRLPDGTYVWDLLFHMAGVYVNQGRAGTRAAVLLLAQAIDTAALCLRFLQERAERETRRHKRQISAGVRSASVTRRSAPEPPPDCGPLRPTPSGRRLSSVTWPPNRAYEGIDRSTSGLTRWPDLPRLVGQTKEDLAVN
jgi:hypothetical protein